VSRLALLRAACLPFEALRGLDSGGIAAATDERLAASADLERRARALSDSLFAAAGPPSDGDSAARARFALLRVRRAVHAHERPRAADLEHAAPLLGASRLAALRDFDVALDRLSAACSIYEARYALAAAAARRELNALTVLPLVEHGITLASRSLVPKVRRLAQCDPAGWRHQERHTAAKAAAYVARFAAKTSPNGVFCAVAPAWVGGTEARVEGEGGVARTEVLLSLAEVRKVTACLAADPALADAIVPRPNPTLRERAGEWTWWKPATPRHATDEEIHARATDQVVLRAFVEEAARGARPTGALMSAVAARTGRREDELLEFFAKLVGAGILIAEMEIPWSSRRRFRDLAARTARNGASADWIGALEAVEDEVDRLATLPLEARAAAMERIAREVATLPRRRPFRPDELFRVDSATALDVRLPERVLDDLTRTMSRFTPLLAGLYPKEVQHRRLIRRFLAHQPPDADVPFLDVYGPLAEPPPEEGSAPPMEFLDPGPQGSPAARRIFDWFVSRAAGAAPAEEVEITLEAGVEPDWMAGVLFQIAARSAADVTAGRFSIAINGVFNGIGLALSRFAHLLRAKNGESPVVAELRRAWSSAARPGAVFAELSFNHEARTANAGLRPVIFEREIELPGDLVSEGVERLPLSDLVIRYDSVDDRLVLRSVRSGLEIVPVLSSGVSPSGIVSSLVHIGRQGLQPVGWLPGFHAPGIMRWPRFRCGRVVLFRERWVFERDRLPRAESSDAGYHLEVARWRAAHHLPRHVFVHTSVETKPFYVDLESPVLVDLLRRASAAAVASEDGRLVVTEMLPAPEDLWVRDAAGSYATEFLIQMDGPARAIERSPLAEVGAADQAPVTSARDSSS